MKRSILFALTGVLLMQIGLAQHTQEQAHTVAKMEMLSPYFLFKPQNASTGTISKEKPQGRFSAGKKEDGFTIKMRVNFQPFAGEQTLLEIPGMVTVKLRQADPAIRDRQNYPAALMQDGSLPVLEAGVMLTPSSVNVFKRQLDIGYPLAALKNPWGEHEIILHFTGVTWSVYADNELMDNEFAIGYPSFGNDHSWRIDPAMVSEASIFFPAMIAERDSRKKEEKMPNVQYWTPRGHNSWVGDVATLYHNGRYHVFYLYDRRHHASKFGVGGHYFEHFSTADFKTWTEHEAATPIEEQWETIGTGTPFAYNNKLHISYGLHTSRIYPDSLTMYPRIMDYYRQHQKSGYFLGDATKAYPSGATYSVSADNISNFKKSGVLFHYSENPSVFTTADGKLKMFANYKAKGTWESQSLDSGWYCTDTAFPLGGDCTFYFTWGKYEYIVGGFVNLWKRPLGAAGEPWRDEVADGKDLYNGVGVPSVSAIGNGRYIMAGWMPINGWGGPFLVHELIQYPDGKLGTKWMKELVPDTKNAAIRSKKIEQASAFPVEENSFILSFDVHPKNKKNGKLAVSFLSPDDDQYEKACALQIDINALTAQYSAAVKDSFAAPEKSLRQGGSPQHVGNYAIENVMGMDKPFSVRILVKSNAKLGGTIIDTEIAGQNTLVSYRQGLTVKDISFNPQALDIRNVRIMKMEE
ncbi:MAG: hypothetical protein ACTHLE_22785 [Agriterribacter sp.]